jgi:peptidyl-prolyl cis-trans isomerase C
MIPTNKLPAFLLLAALATPLALAQTPAPSSAAPQTPAKPAAAKPSTKPYLTVNGYTIPQHTVDAFIAEQKARGLDTTTPTFRQAIREEMIRRGALLAEAKKQSLDKRPEYKRQVELSAQVLLMRDVVAEHIKRHPVTDADMDAAYRDALARLGNTEYKLRHIQSKTEADAQKIIAQLNDGKKFDKLLKQSTDEATRDQGGNLGWKIPAALLPEVAEHIRPLKAGEHTRSPIKIGEAWHTFQIETLRPVTPPKREEIESRLLQGIIQAKAAQYVDSLKSTAQIK